METKEWIEVEKEMPKPGKRVQVCVTYQSVSGNERQSVRIAAFRPHKWEDASYCDECDVWGFTDDDGDTYWWPEGWYEDAMEAEQEWMIEKPVTHWMPLTEKPNPRQD